jgi:carbon-monoxide dehydrogenase small subunit
MHISCWVNDGATSLDVAPNDLLLDTLRDELGLTGAKRSCDAQVCGACTVLVDGLAVSSCTTLTAEVDGATVETIEGRADGGALSSVQQAFVDAGAFQCGFCTPGMVMMVEALVRDHPEGDDEDAASYLKGTLCRCTGYVKILEAIREARAAQAAQQVQA